MPADVEPLIGNFLNMIPLRCDLSGGPTFLQVLRRTRRMTLRAFSKAALPFEKIVENVTFRRDPSRNPIFQTMIEILPAVTSQIGELQVDRFDFDPRFAQFDLSFHAWEEAYGYGCRFEYCTELFRADTIQRMSANFVQLLSSVVADPSQRIATIPILTELERTQLLVDWNRTSRAYPDDQCLHHLFETTAARNPNRIAVECGGRTLTYGELNVQANRLANHLIASGVKTEELVGIYLERSTDLVIGLLGILKAGAAYVPLDPLFPPERLAYMIEDAGISILVTHSNLQEALPSRERKLIYVDLDAASIGANSAQDPSIPVQPSNLAYTIYTSGSSGKPKGVMIEHRSLVNCLTAMQNEPGFNGREVMVAVTTISFDIAALEIFLPLISGGKLVIAAKDEAMDGSLLAALIQHSRATMLQATPSTWRLLLDANWQTNREFKMLCGGEVLPRELANRLLEHGGQLWNMYGPTETTIWSAVQKVRSTTGAVPIGPPIANTQLYIVDEELEPVPIGVPGELLIGGHGLARGYLNRPDLTGERFVNTRLVGSQARVYKTGDLAKFRSDGCIEFLGRRDFQVKVRGYRIELEEIQNVLAQQDSVKDAAVVAWEEPDGDTRLVAYYVPLAGKKSSDGDLRQHLREKLPEYMCPSFFVELQEFPLTPNGKVDRKAFPNPAVSAFVRSNHAEPQTPLESRLVDLWQEVLKRPVGLDDNFFELGGHSLLAARLFVLIEKKLGVTLPLATLFPSPSIRSLAKKIEQKVRPSEWSSLVPIQTKGSRPPLFLVHGAEGNVLLYRNLAECLGKDQPVYGLQSQGLDGGTLFDGTLENIAAKYLKEIQSIQPAGPYYLGGYCLGGTIAFEIARQLKSAGESLALLALVETYNVRSRPPVSAPLRIVHKAQNVYFQTRNLLLSRSRVQFLAEKLQIELSRLRVYTDILRTKLVDRSRSTRGAGYQHLRIREANHQAQAAYQPGPYEGKITLFRSKIHFRGFDDPCFGWKSLAMEGVRVIEMANFPHGFLNQPFVRDLAHALEAEIDGGGGKIGAILVARKGPVDG
jgi:amino acid adenylation domain-containing protein